jgi:hypothetical protein
MLLAWTAAAAVDTTVDLPRRLPLALVALLVPLARASPPRHPFSHYVPSDTVFTALAVSLAASAVPLLTPGPPVHAGHRALRLVGWIQAAGALVTAALATPALSPALAPSTQVAYTWALFFHASSTAFRALYAGVGVGSVATRTAWVGTSTYLTIDLLTLVIIIKVLVRQFFTNKVTNNATPFCLPLDFIIVASLHILKSHHPNKRT